MSRRIALPGDVLRQDGQTMAEYSVTLAVITVFVVAAFVALSDTVQATITEIISRMP